MILHGDCLDRLKALADNSVDSVVTDPPYGLKFMGKKWDHDVPSIAIWAECLRVLKPGGHLLSFGGTRTYHRLVVAIEEAGFEIRDQIMWLYGSGFPKSHDVSKAIDKQAGHWRGKAGEITTENAAMSGSNYERTPKGDPITAAAAAWQGWGTALKPAFEPVVLATKPLTIGDLLTSLARECQSLLFAEIVKANSPLNLNEKTQQFIAQWLAGESTLTPDVLSEVMDMLQSESAKYLSLSTELSWLNTLAVILRNVNTFTTETASSLTMDLRILNSLLSSNTQKSTLQNAGLGEQFNASLVQSLFSVLAQKLSFIHISSAQGPAIAEDAHSKSPLADSPANEPIVLARKPLIGTVAENVLEFGTGGLNIDATRVGTDKISTHGGGDKMSGMKGNGNSGVGEYREHIGRFPANIILDEVAAEMLDEQSGQLKSGTRKPTLNSSGNGWKNSCEQTLNEFGADSGGASRFFYVAKASKRERDAGLDDMRESTAGERTGRKEGSAGITGYAGATGSAKNFHPTVKPIKLMEYLIKLVTPPGGTVLDPFAGSGSTGVAATKLGFDFIGIEMNEEYVAIAEKRIEAAI